MKVAIWMKDGRVVRSRYVDDSVEIDLAGMDCLIVPMCGDESAWPQLYLTSGEVVYAGRDAAFLLSSFREIHAWGPKYERLDCPSLTNSDIA